MPGDIIVHEKLQPSATQTFIKLRKQANELMSDPSARYVANDVEDWFLDAEILKPNKDLTVQQRGNLEKVIQVMRDRFPQATKL